MAPAYAGGSVGSLAASVLNAFGVDVGTRPPALLPPIDAKLLNAGSIASARVLVLLVVDGLGAGVLQRQVARGGAPGLAGLGPPAILTSVFPSTTTAALTSIQTGLAPGQHGMAGYTLNLAATGRVVNMITFKPVDGGAFTTAAPDPASMVAGSSLFARLQAAGIPSVVVSHREYADSPLTRAHSRATPFSGHRTQAEFATLTLRTVMDACRARERRFVFAYWAGFDTLAHSYGPDSATCALELELLDHALRVGLLEPLARLADNVTLLVTADHGLAPLDPGGVRFQNEISALTGPWSHPPTGERRALGLALSDPGGASRLAELVGELGLVVPVHDAIEAGLYGPQPRHAELDSRIGNTLLLARHGASFPFRITRDAADVTTGGAHGSLTPDEMLVPLLAHRFGE